jgi:broad-specificity NMP kinase
MLVLGVPGTGKSSIMSKIADDTVDRAISNRIPGYVVDKDETSSSA